MPCFHALPLCINYIWIWPALKVIQDNKLQQVGHSVTPSLFLIFTGMTGSPLAAHQPVASTDRPILAARPHAFYIS